MALFATWVAALGCRAPGARDSASTPYALLLGTAQDGGLPQIGCSRDCCTRARRAPAEARLVSSLLLVDPLAGQRYLLDATPDIAQQVELARGHPSNRQPPGPRPPLFDGVLLTHAHMGHYSGLLQLGKEVYGARGVPTWVSERMGAFLRANEPWATLVNDGGIELRLLRDGVAVQLTENLRVTPVTVPHRDEFSDTFAFFVEGPSGSLLFLPDIDKWERWQTPIEEWVERVDVALLDGSFFDASKLPGRDISEIPHPLISESIARFAELPRASRAKIRFTHLNHSNPAADPTSDASRAVERAGHWVARDADRIAL